MGICQTFWHIQVFVAKERILESFLYASNVGPRTEFFKAIPSFVWMASGGGRWQIPHYTSSNCFGSTTTVSLSQKAPSTIAVPWESGGQHLKSPEALKLKHTQPTQSKLSLIQEDSTQGKMPQGDQHQTGNCCIFYTSLVPQWLVELHQLTTSCLRLVQVNARWLLMWE